MTTVPQILQCATALFLERGYERTSMEAVARGVGISAPSLYWHFANKEELCFTILFDLSQHLNSQIEALPANEPAANRLRRFVYTHVVTLVRYIEERGDTRLLYSFPQLSERLSTAHQEALQRLTEGFISVLRSILDAGEREEAWALSDATVVTYAIANLGDMVTSWYRPGGRLTIEQIGQQYGQLAVAIARAERPIVTPKTQS